MAAVARMNLAVFPEVHVVTAPFEQWEPSGSSFDLVLAATSWHWIDPGVRYAKATAVLGQEGALAIIATHHVLPLDGDRFFAEVQSAYREIGEDDSPPPAWSSSSSSPPDGIADERADIEASGFFTDVQVSRYLVGQVVHGRRVRGAPGYILGASRDGAGGASVALRRDPPANPRAAWGPGSQALPLRSPPCPTGPPESAKITARVATDMAGPPEPGPGAEGRALEWSSAPRSGTRAGDHAMMWLGARETFSARVNHVRQPGEGHGGRRVRAGVGKGRGWGESRRARASGLFCRPGP